MHKRRAVFVKIAEEFGNAGNQFDDGRVDTPGKHGAEAGTHAEANHQPVFGGFLPEAQRQMNHHFRDRREFGHAYAIYQQASAHSLSGGNHGGGMIAHFNAVRELGAEIFCQKDEQQRQRK